MRINWSEPALADLEAIYDFIARDSSHYAAGSCGGSSKPSRRRAASGRLVDVILVGELPLLCIPRSESGFCGC